MLFFVTFRFWACFLSSPNSRKSGFFRSILFSVACSVTWNETPSSYPQIIQTISDRVSGDPKVWSILEEIINSLILNAAEVSEDALRTIDTLFNNNKINQFIPMNFTATLCLVINSLYLEEAKEPKEEKEEKKVFEAYLSIVNYCYVLSNNLWPDYEKRMGRNDFGAGVLPE